MTNIPSVNLGADDAAQQFVAAYSDHGFAYVTGHGISEDLIDAVFEQSRLFHALPHATKMAMSLDQNHRGFIPINTSTDVNSDLAKVTKPNQSESLMIMREGTAGGFLEGPNQWPPLPDFRAVMNEYSNALCALGRTMMTDIAKVLGMDPAPVLKAFDNPTFWLRLLHYPPAPSDAPKDLFGSAPHRDFGCLTFLAQDGAGGLQVLTKDNAWIDVPKRKGSFVVNVGDMLHRWSNGILKSTPHRVINTSGRERLSIPFFFDPNVATTIAPWSSCGSPKFQPLLFEDFLRAELGAGYDAHKDTP